MKGLDNDAQKLLTIFLLVRLEPIGKHFIEKDAAPFDFEVEFSFFLNWPVRKYSLKGKILLRH